MSSTDVVTTETEKSKQGVLPEPIRQALQLRRMVNEVAKELSGMSWGAAVTDSTRRAMAEWGQTHGVDVVTEIDILGNRIYLNSKFYQRKLSEMVAAGKVDYFYSDHIQHDERLEKMAKDGNEAARKELGRREMERIYYNIQPDNIAGACAFHVKVKGLDREVMGAKWCGPNSGRKDPVGAEFPSLTAESRAIRRAMRLLVSHVPEMAGSLGPAELAAKALEITIHADHEQMMAWAKQSRVKPLLAPVDAYAEPTKAVESVEVAPKPTGDQLDPDLFADDEE